VTNWPGAPESQAAELKLCERPAAEFATSTPHNQTVAPVVWIQLRRYNASAPWELLSDRPELIIEPCHCPSTVATDPELRRPSGERNHTDILEHAAFCPQLHPHRCLKDVQRREEAAETDELPILSRPINGHKFFEVLIVIIRSFVSTFTTQRPSPTDTTRKSRLT
jgi:hypothetical protein